MTTTSRSVARRVKAAPVQQMEDEDDYYSAAASVQPVQSSGSYATKPKARLAQTHLYAQPEEETADDDAHNHHQQSQPHLSSSTRRVSQLRPPASSSSTSSYPLLSPTSVAAFDPLASPATRTVAARALTKRAALNTPTHSRSGSQAGSASQQHQPPYDYFDAIDPSPPAYEQVLASDDIIAAQFNSQLSLVSPQHKQQQLPPHHDDDVSRLDVSVTTPRGSNPNVAPMQVKARNVQTAAAPLMRRDGVRPVKGRSVRAEVVEEDEEEVDDDEREAHAEQVKVARPPVLRRTGMLQKAASQPVRRREAEEEVWDEDDYRTEEKQMARVQRRRQQSAPVLQQRQQGKEDEDDDAVVLRGSIPVVKKRSTVISRQSASVANIRVTTRETQPVRSRRKMEAKQREEAEEVEQEENDEEEENVQRSQHASRGVNRQPSQPAGQRRRPAAKDIEDEEDENVSDKPPPHPPQHRKIIKAAASSSSFPSSSSPRPFRPARAKIDALAFMRAGTPFLKYTSSFISSPPHFRQFQLMTAPAPAIVWFSQAKSLSDTSIPLSAITAILLGQQTATFARHKAEELVALSFSIVYTDQRGKERTLDLTAKDGNEMNIWLAGLDRMRQITADALQTRKRVLVSINVMYGGSPSQEVVDTDSGRVVDTRKKSQIKEDEVTRRGGRGGGEGGDEGELDGIGRISAVHSSLYRELQPRFQRLQLLLMKRKDDVKKPAVASSPLRTSISAMLSRVEAKCTVVSDALMDGQLELADQQLWLASVELDGVDNMLASIK